jgi:hypothetical protein
MGNQRAIPRGGAPRNPCRVVLADTRISGRRLREANRRTPAQGSLGKTDALLHKARRKPGLMRGLRLLLRCCLTPQAAWTYLIMRIMPRRWLISSRISGNAGRAPARRKLREFAIHFAGMEFRLPEICKDRSYNSHSGPAQVLDEILW